MQTIITKLDLGNLKKTVPNVLYIIIVEIQRFTWGVKRVAPGPQTWYKLK